MKLLYKTTRDYLLASFSILIVTGVALFAILRNEVGDEMNEQLELQTDQIFENARSGNFINAPFSKIEKVSVSTPLGKVFGDSMIYDRVQAEIEEYHYLRETKMVGPTRYQAIAMTSHIGWDQYYLSILYIFMLTAILITGSGVIINYVSNKKIWTPFFHNLQNAQAFSVTSPTGLQLDESSIDEFKELNKTLKELTDRGRKEYLALREFTENASHEIQTPLSIIQSKLDRMSQMDVNEQMADHIVQARSGVDRLSKMNRNLLLLAKLDNDIFNDRHRVRIDDLIKKQIINMEDLFSHKKIKIEESLDITTAYSDPYLADTLISNLLSNALRYTPSNGLITINLSNNFLSISNTGPEPDFPKELIFERFTKNPLNVTSTGLGLAIVKEICLLNQWNISYQYQNSKNCFEVRF